MEQAIIKVIEEKIQGLFAEEIKRNNEFRQSVNAQLKKMKQDVDSQYKIM